MLRTLQSVLYRYRVLFAALYLALLGALGYGLWWFHHDLSRSLDVGFAVVARNLAYQRTFVPVEKAREDLAAGDLDKAQQRLELLTGAHSQVQPDQLFTHAVSDAHELLAEVFVAQGRIGKAVKTLERITALTPLNYWLWLVRARLEEQSGDVERAVLSFREAFKLAPNHPDIAGEYVEALSVLNASEEIVWVAREFEGAVRRGTPLLTAKVGTERRVLERRLLGLAGVDVEHGNFDRTKDFDDLERGAGKALMLPPEMLAARSSADEFIVLQMRFEGIYDGLVIDAVRHTARNGDRGELSLAEHPIAYQHRAHSGVEFYAEVCTPYRFGELAALEVVYSCPESKLSKDVRAIVEKAAINLAARGGP